MSNIKNRYQYQMGGWSPNTQAGVQQGGMALGSFVSQLDGDKPSVGNGVASGALTGAATGAAAGPIGAAAGAVVGGVIGGINASKKAKEIDRQQKQFQEQLNSQFRDYSQSVLQNYPSQGVQVAGYYAKYGGKIPSYLTNALAEGGEVVVSNTPPSTDNNGDLNQLASNVSKFEGDSHEASSGGIGFKSTSDSYIFSDSLRTPDGLTYAKQAELFGKQKGKFEKKLKESVDEASSNTAKRMLEKIDKNIGLLFQHQEQFKDAS